MKLRFALFYHSLVSDWNHGNAHFLRGIASELLARGHFVHIFEPEDSWSYENLRRFHGAEAINRFAAAFPALTSTRYRLDGFNLEAALDGIDIALVHEWSPPSLIAAIGQYRRRNPNLRVFFHDTHHRAVTKPEEINQFDLSEYDGVLAYGGSLARAYERLGWGNNVYVWHEAADVRVFYPRPTREKSGDVVWIGNWGDDERTEELREFLMTPVRALGLEGQIYGVRYPESAIAELDAAGLRYRGWLPNANAPEVFAQFRATVHVPRRPYTRQLPGIPTIRPFEALACGIPLVSAPWNDCEHLFRVGQDFLMAHNGAEMQSHLSAIMQDRELSNSLAASGLETIRSFHTCAHRVDQLLLIYDGLRPSSNIVASSTPVEVHS